METTDVLSKIEFDKLTASELIDVTDDTLICGIDEVGRGPFAGPVVVAAVIMPLNTIIEGINDSKKLSIKKRESLNNDILNNAVSYSYGIVDNLEIDKINILQATYKAAYLALDNLKVKPDIILTDALDLNKSDYNYIQIIKGDTKSYNIASASIIAKVYRDKMMDEFAIKYPGYYFEKNKGYGTKQHIEAIKNLGITPIHRKTFITKYI